MIARLAATAAALLACAPATATATAQSPEGGPWRMQRLYGPEREMHEPFRFWLSTPDLAAADGQPRPRVRMLMLNPDSGWSIIETEYLCGEDRARRLEARRFDAAGGQMFADTYAGAPTDLGGIDPETVAYGVVCGGVAEGQVEAATVAAGREREAEDHALYLAAVAATATERPTVEEAPCHGNILRNPLFGLAGTDPAAGQGSPITRTFMGLPQTLWAWRTTTGDGPRWASPETPGDGPLYLREGQSILQSDLRVTGGRWRLVLGAAGDAPAGLHGVIEGDEAFEFEIAAAGPPTLNVVELDLPAGAERLTLTGTGAGEVRLMMACLTPLD